MAEHPLVGRLRRLRGPTQPAGGGGDGEPGSAAYAAQTRWLCEQLRADVAALRADLWRLVGLVGLGEVVRWLVTMR